MAKDFGLSKQIFELNNNIFFKHLEKKEHIKKIFILTRLLTKE
jgi:hypothetical protein